MSEATATVTPKSPAAGLRATSSCVRWRGRAQTWMRGGYKVRGERPGPSSAFRKGLRKLEGIQPGASREGAASPGGTISAGRIEWVPGDRRKRPRPGRRQAPRATAQVGTTAPGRNMSGGPATGNAFEGRSCPVGRSSAREVRAATSEALAPRRGRPRREVFCSIVVGDGIPPTYGFTAAPPGKRRAVQLGPCERSCQPRGVRGDSR